MIIGRTPPPRSRPSVVTSSWTCSSPRCALLLSKYSRATYRMHGMSLSTPVKDTVSRVAVAVAVAVAVSRVRVHRLAAISASGRERASVPSLSVSFRVSPTLAAAEGRQSTGPYHPSWRVGRKVGKAPSSDERGSPVPGRSVANVCSSGVPLAVVCSFERKGCGSTLGQQELAGMCGPRVRWCWC